MTLPADERFFYAYYMSTSRQQTSQNLPTPRRYIRQTVSLPVTRTKAGINVLTLRKILGINTRDTINAHLKALGYFRDSRYEEKILSWSQVKDVLGLHLWLRLGIYQHLPGIGWEVCNEIERREKELIDKFKPLWNNSPVP